MAEPLPASANSSVVLHLAAARIKELHHLQRELEQCKSGKGGRSYQKLPRHMQRRALSSNPKRLPRRLRRRHLAEGEPPRPSKRPAAKHRPRPRAGEDKLDAPIVSSRVNRVGAARVDRVGDYERRQSVAGNTWLETHVWHAKRFHMTRRWGYALPLRPTQKMYRPTLRAAAQRCVLQDRSFMCCVELRGDACVMSALEACVSESVRQQLISVSSGGIVSLTLYKPRMCPRQAVCEVEVQKLPSLGTDSCDGNSDRNGAADHCNRRDFDHNDVEGGASRLWLWVHPASHEDLLQLLRQIFSLQPQIHGHCVNQCDEEPGEAMETTNDDHDLCNDRQHSHDKKLKSINNNNIDSNELTSVQDVIPEGNETQNFLDVDTTSDVVLKSKVKRKHRLLQQRLDRAGAPDYVSADNRVAVTCLRDTLNRFCLRGPETYRVLKTVLLPSTVVPQHTKLVPNNPTHDSQSVEEKSLHKARSSDEDTADETSGSGNLSQESQYDEKSMNKSRSLNDTTVDEANFFNGGTRTSEESAEDSSSWWTSFFGRMGRAEAHAGNAALWGTAPRVTEDLVLPLVVRDPRVVLPRARVKMSETSAEPPSPSWGRDAVAPLSPLYDPRVRRALLRHRCTDHDINTRRHREAVPGAMLPLDDEEARLPVLLLLRRPQGDDVSGKSAVDVVIPGGWGSNFWTALVLAGAVATGVDSELHFMREELTLPPSYSLPDLPSGKRYEEAEALERHEAYFRMPPDKRPNFIKLGVQFPFSFPWSKLVASLRSRDMFHQMHEICSGFSREVLLQLGLDGGKISTAENEASDEEIVVMRNPRFLSALDYISCCSGSRRRIFRGVDQESEGTVDTLPVDGSESNIRTSSEEALGLSLDELTDMLKLMKQTSQSYLVRVQVTLIGKGALEPGALICRPNSQDLVHLKEVLTNALRPSVHVSMGITEPSCRDSNEEKRKKLKEEHARDLAKLQRLRKAARQRVRRQHEPGSGGLDAAVNQALSALEETQQELVARCAAFKSSMERLWLPCPEAPLQQTSRLIIGSLTDAAFSRTRGCGVGQGYVVAATLISVAQHRVARWKGVSPDQPDVANKKRKFDECSRDESSSLSHCSSPGKRRHTETGLDSKLPATVASTSSAISEEKIKLDKSKQNLLIDDSSNDSSCSSSQENNSEIISNNETFDVDLPLVHERGVPVLVRNINSLQYRFGMLTVCSHQPPP
ncbi:ribonucleases P/MRP protein subunit POP1 [Hyalella azteca]|uniref:Ribonucleases P/MRP protein subunit POP1 n=1 Tax=Hyalella azteca TaxID=294128 RepID=A0A8B7NN57_HYAAZ|nr:ribonucleases P/MRP protein subunit POP1 [Hyalella azteca]